MKHKICAFSCTRFWLRNRKVDEFCNIPLHEALFPVIATCLHFTQDEVEERAAAVLSENVALGKSEQSEERAEQEMRLRIDAEDAHEVAARARLVAESNESDAIAEAGSWRETALVAENAMEDLATTPFETPAQEWQWMEASVQDEVSVRAVEEAARAHAEQAQAQAEEEARLAAAARSEAESPPFAGVAVSYSWQR